MTPPANAPVTLAATPPPQHKLPRHVAIIMDGNGRWAERRGAPRNLGHHAGVESVRRVVERCVSEGIEALTLFAFSSENWRRPRREVSLLFDLFVSALARHVKRLHNNGVRLRVIGAREALPEKLQKRIDEAEQLTANNDRLTLQVAANYGGRWDIVAAAQHLAREVAAGRLDADAIDEPMFAGALSFPGLPEPDLLIRTGGERRISNFLLWQLAYTELHFTDVLWPDFDENAFSDALEAFRRRQRRFGLTGEQIEALKHGHA
ncbi:MAG: isoprenyl transferase [Chromatiales bacterium]|nr:isoprenyl transferase [Chromatiales bacterium]